MHRPPDQGKQIAQQEKSTQPAGRWSDGIAIVGMSARFPRSRNVQEFWSVCLPGKF